MNTLPDYIDYGLEILSIGLNPSTISVEKGYYFANPRNRFWSALDKSELIAEKVTPSAEAHKKIFNEYKIGFTDVVKRHSSMGKDLCSADYIKWAPLLKIKIEKYAPKICWFHGKVAAKNYLKYAEHYSLNLDWGKQNIKLKNSIIFVSPNTSPANAAYSLDDIVHWFKVLKNLNNNSKDLQFHT